MCKNHLPLENIPIEHHHKILYMNLINGGEYVIYMLSPYNEFTDKNDTTELATSLVLSWSDNVRLLHTCVILLPDHY